MAEIKVNAAFCKSCELCISVCPKDVLVKSAEVNKAGYHYVSPGHPEKCVGCAQCAVFCPEGAIEVYR